MDEVTCLSLLLIGDRPQVRHESKDPCPEPLYLAYSLLLKQNPCLI